MRAGPPNIAALAIISPPSMGYTRLHDTRASALLAAVVKSLFLRQAELHDLDLLIEPNLYPPYPVIAAAKRPVMTRATS